MSEPLTFPVVNLNGSSQSVLMAQAQAGQDAAQVLVEAILGSMPHARDYQTAPAGSFERARDQHLERLRAAQKTESEFRALRIALMRQSRFGSPSTPVGEKVTP